MKVEKQMNIFCLPAGIGISCCLCWMDCWLCLNTLYLVFYAAAATIPSNPLESSIGMRERR